MNVKRLQKQQKKAKTSSVNIPNMISNAYLNKNRFYQKQPKIRPRIGIFGNTFNVTVKRDTANNPEDIITSKRVKARMAGNLDYLLRQSDSESRHKPPESYINLPVRNPSPGKTIWKYGPQKNTPPVQRSNNNIDVSANKRMPQPTIYNEMVDGTPVVDLISLRNLNVGAFDGSANTMDLNIRAGFKTQPPKLSDDEFSFDLEPNQRDDSFSMFREPGSGRRLEDTPSDLGIKKTII